MPRRPVWGSAEPPRPAPVQLGAQRLDLRLTVLFGLLEQDLARFERFGLGAEVEASLAQIGERGVESLGLLGEPANPLVGGVGLLVDALESSLGFSAAAGERLALTLGADQVRLGAAELDARIIEAGLRVGQRRAGEVDGRIALRHTLHLDRHAARELGQLGALLLQLARALCAAIDETFDLAVGCGDALIELLGLAALILDLALGQLDAVLELVDGLLETTEATLLDR